MPKAKRSSARAWAAAEGTSNERAKAFRSPTTWVQYHGPLTAKLKRQVDLFLPRLQAAPGWRNLRLQEKKTWAARLLQATLRARFHRGAVAIRRSKHDPKFNRTLLQVVDAFTAAGLLHEYRSLPGSPKMSRYTPTRLLLEYGDADPWTFDGNRITRFVYLYERRGKGKELPFDLDEDPVAADVQHRLFHVNSTNENNTITHRVWDEDMEEMSCDWRIIRPVHFAVFTGDFNHHGRIYTGEYGHQALRREERATLLFDGSKTIELDFGGMHPRLLYHLDGREYQGDPYALWGKQTSPLARLMAKVCLNAAINADNREAAIGACNFALSSRTRDGAHKEGKALRHARLLYKAYRKTGLKFNDVYDTAVRKHAKIAHHFCTDAGIRLMNVDGAIALDVLFYFASHGTPCLGCHDSFITLHRCRHELARVMAEKYEERIGFVPVVKQSRIAN